MTIDRLKEFYNCQPFRPFEVLMGYGRTIRVNRRDAIMLVPSGKTVVVLQSDESFDFVDLAHATDASFIRVTEEEMNAESLSGWL